MSCAEALDDAARLSVFVSPRMRSTGSTRARSGRSCATIVPTVEQAGIDEGYLDLGAVAPSFDDARALAEAVRAVVGARTRLSCSLGVATTKVVAKVASDRRKPGGLTAVRPGQRSCVPGAASDPHPPGNRPTRRGAFARDGGRADRPARSALRRPAAAVLPGKVGRLVRDRARGIDPRTLEVSTERISISSEETFERDVAEPARLHEELRRMAGRLAEHLRSRGQTARTVTTKLRYPDFAIRTRSSSLEMGIADAQRIGVARLQLARSCARATAPARYAWSASASRASPTMLSSRSRSVRAPRVDGYDFADRDPRALRRNRRAGHRTPLELPRLVRGRARRVPRAVSRAATSACATRASRRWYSRRTSPTAPRLVSTTAWWFMPAASRCAAPASASNTWSNATAQCSPTAGPRTRRYTPTRCDPAAPRAGCASRSPPASRAQRGSRPALARHRS